MRPEGDGNLLEVEDLEVTFGDSTVVDRVSFTLQRGEKLAIVGQSGSGKSSTIGAILRLLPSGGRIAGGRILLNAPEASAGSSSVDVPSGTVNLVSANESLLRRIRGRRISLVPQDPMSNLNPSMKVGQQVADALVPNRLLGGFGDESVRRRAVELMTEAGIPEADRRYGQYPHEFSGGMRQRVLIAIALAGQPELIIADEPTSALDVTVQRQILEHLQTLVERRGTSLLLVTHDLGLAADRADRIMVMSEGHVVETGKPRQILLAPFHDYTRQLVAAAPSVAAALQEEPLLEKEQDEDDADEEATAPATYARNPQTILSVQQLVKAYRLRGQREQVTAVDNVSFEVPRGTTTAVVGESGSGKSTIARLLLGLETATSGQALVAGEDIASSGGRQRRVLRRLIQPVFQDPYGSLDPTFDVAQLVDEPLRIFGWGDRHQRRARVMELLDRVALPRIVAERNPHELSGGQRQRVAIARALAPSPDILVLDEAVSALDVLVQDQVLRLLADLQQQLGLTYLFITHDLAVVRQIAHDVLVMRRGRVVERGSVEQVFESPAEEYTRELLAAIPGAAFVS